MVLGDIIDHLTPNRAYEQYYNQLKLIVQRILAHIQDYELLLVMVSLIKLVYNFNKFYINNVYNKFYNRTIFYV